MDHLYNPGALFIGLFTAIMGASMALFVVAIVFLMAISPMLFTWLWNATMPELFGWKAIRFWQSVRLLLMAWILLSVPHCGNNDTSSKDPNQKPPTTSSSSTSKLIPAPNP